MKCEVEELLPSLLVGIDNLASGTCRYRHHLIGAAKLYAAGVSYHQRWLAISTITARLPQYGG